VRYAAGAAERRGCKSTRLTFIDELFCLLLVAFYLFSQFLDRFGIDLLRFVDQLFADLGVALYDFVQTFFGNVVRALSCFPWARLLDKTRSIWLNRPVRRGFHTCFRPQA